MRNSERFNLTPEQEIAAQMLLGQIESGQCQVVDIMSGDPDTQYDSDDLARRTNAQIAEFVATQARRGITRMPRVIIVNH